jgi:hypothetical protein
MIALDATKHESIGQDAKLLERLGSRSLVAELLDGVEEFLIEYRNMLHATVVATRAAIVLVHLPVESRARTLLAEVARIWFDIEEADK